MKEKGILNISAGVDIAKTGLVLARVDFTAKNADNVLDYWLTHPDIGTADEMAKMLFKMLYRQDPPEDYRYSILLS